MDISDGFIPIVAIFYAVFHPIEGTKIVHQFPEDSISTAGNGGEEGMFDFDTIKNYVIPKPQLCNRLISLKIDKYKVIGYPVNMESSYYARNSFNFNFCFVFRYGMGDISPYESAIKRMGQMFQVLEEQSFMLSSLDKDNAFFKENPFVNGKKPPASHFEINGLANIDSTIGIGNNSPLNIPGFAKTKRIALSSIESLIQQIYQDLNNYSECCIPLDTSNSVDIKLFPILPPPINLKAYQVPIATVRLQSLVDVNWDPTMIKVLPYINGLNSVKRISELADANYLLTKQCIQHLMHYKCIEIVDIFQFSNIYAPTNHIGNFLRSDGKMAEECQAYVVSSDTNTENSSFANTPSQLNSPHNNNGENSPTYNYKSSFGSASVSPYTKSTYLSKSPRAALMAHNEVKVPTKATLFYLYRSLNQGQTIKEWYIQQRKYLDNIDIRRFINFGVLRGIIYRVYSYPFLNSITNAIQGNETTVVDNMIDRLQRKKPRRRTTGGTNENLLKTKVNERTLRTDVKRKVSFTYSQSDKHDIRRIATSEAILEDDSTEEEEDDHDDDDEEESDDDESRDYKVGAYIGGAENNHMVPISERRHRVSSSSYYIDDESDEADESEENLGSSEEHKAMVDLLKMLKGFQSFDSICTELNKSRAEVEEMIGKLGSVNIVNS